MKSVKKLAFISIALGMLASGLFASVAWFEPTTNSFSAKISGSVVEEYFHCGKGTQDDPFVITRPVHYYHLTEFFQRETVLNVSSTESVTFGTDYLYFQVGYPLKDNDSSLYVYDYDNTGAYTGTINTPAYSKTLNLSYFSGNNALMPIGTNEVPFFGSFDGGAQSTASNGITISNLNIKTSDTVLIGNTTTNRSTSDVGVFGYVADQKDASHKTVIANAYFDNLTIDLSGASGTNTSDSGHVDAHPNNEIYVGYIVGHMHTYTSYDSTGPANSKPIHDVYVNNAKIEGGASAKSHFGYVGFADTIDGVAGSEIDIADIIDTLEGQSHGGGDEPDWGGTIDMKSLYTRLNSFKSQATNIDLHKRVKTINSSGVESAETTQLVSSNAFKNYADDANKKGSVCFSGFSGTGSDLLNLTGSQYMKLETTDYTNVSKFVFFHDYSKHYLYPRVSGNVQTVSSDTPNPPPANYGWNYDSSDTTLPTTSGGTLNLGKVHAEIDGVTYYLYFTTVSGSVRARTSTNASDGINWTLTYLGYYGNSSIRQYSLSASYNGGTYYLRKNAAANTTKPSTGTNSGAWCAIIDSQPTVYTTPSTTLEACYDTYIPLNVNDSYGAKLKNTGYIVSSSDYEGIHFPSDSGVIRTGYHTRSQFPATTDTIYTYYNGSQTTASSISNYGKYAENYADFETILNEDNTRFYGLHFMNSTIDKNNCVTVPSGYINGSTISNYKIPKNCIDFNLHEKGVIAFFAGTYYIDATAFFSLHKINRSGTTITSIEEIKKIYKKNGDDNANYLYETSASVPGSTTGYTLVFNTDWITNPSLTAQRLYYFEIPMNSGEYCLGSVTGKDGAYLMYLDIGAAPMGDVDPDYNTENKISNDPIFTQMEYISNGYVINSCFNIAYAVPAGATKENFWIKVSRSGDVFAVEVVNTTSSAFEIHILLVDNDTDPTNDYPYSYTLKYNTGTVSSSYGYSASFTGAANGSAFVIQT